MALHARKKLEITVEKRRLQTVVDLLDQDGEVTGYTVLRTLGGRGHTGERLPQPYSDVLATVVVVAIVKAEVAERLVEALAPLIEEIVGIVSVSDVQVMRAGHF
jgi:nitrogen regulatory protein PII